MIVGLYGVSLCLLMPSVLSIGGFGELSEIFYECGNRFGIELCGSATICQVKAATARCQGNGSPQVSSSACTKSTTPCHLNCLLTWTILSDKNRPILECHMTNFIARFYRPILSAINLLVEFASNFAEKMADKIGRYNRPILSFVCHRLYKTDHTYNLRLTDWLTDDDDDA